MSPITRSALGWGSLYCLLALLPIGWLLLSPPAPRSWLGETAVLLGALALSIMALQALVSGRHAWFAHPVGFDNVLQFHRQVGIGALFLVIAHPVALFIAHPSLLHFVDPRDETLRALMLMALLGASVILIISSLWRKRFGLSYERWRLMHGGLALFIVFGGLGHALMAQRYTEGIVTSAGLALLILLPASLVLETRLLRPWRMRRHPWRVVNTTLERGDTTTLTLESTGAHRFAFQPGQFLWITLGDTPWSLQQHPFSLSSSAANSGRITFSAKRLGDFTRQLPNVTTNTLAFIEGPFGAFTPRSNNSSGLVMIAGGIGITPFMSMLYTFRDQQDRQPIWLIYANPTWQEATFRDTLDDLAKHLNLTLIHVISDPHDGWEGEVGYVDQSLLARSLPQDTGQRDYFICGPDPMMDSAEQGLIAQGVAPTNIFSDRFDIV
ncbi:ferric reductase-like transmembrane domain-containing protein [Vreelandella zhaodongensis]|uniref:Ferredoxin reductase family protein n=1 Tax=Vreelandella zhaodongensis TaxID=1176240 RepID=A0ABX2SXI0_VREZH|nr:ferredoxin reductase family protein [Halomonas zhaodongensis]